MMKKINKTPFLDVLKNKATENIRYAASTFRTLPDFLIIGAAKCGTTSLYNYLIQHPQVLPSLKKEVHYFDFKFDKGTNWYKLHFPFKWQKEKNNIPVMSGESSPYYLFHPLAPKRISELLPYRKHLCLLRNPVDRAISNYNHRFRSGFETLPIEKAFEMEQERIAGEEDKIIKNQNYVSYDLYFYAYVARGIYADQLARWFKYVPKEDILIMNSEDFYANTKKHFEAVLKYLKLEPYNKIQFKVFNSGKQEEYYNINPDLREKLIEFYRPHNKRLYDLLGVQFDWDK